MNAATASAAVLSPVPSVAVAAVDAGSRASKLEEFIRQSGFAEHTVEMLAADASHRRYLRVSTPKTSYIVMDAPPEHEPLSSYIRIGTFLHHHGFAAPRIVAMDVEQGFLLLEDLGDMLFTRILGEDADAKAETELYAEAVDVLAAWHTRPEMLRDSSSLQLPPYSHSELMRELALFADWYLPLAADVREAPALAQEFMDIWRSMLLKAPLADCYFVHRDYHAANLLWLSDRKETARVGLLDFQDALWGDPAYDLVSLLEDARRTISPELRDRMKARYIQKTGQPSKLLHERFAILGAQRNLKIIGIFHRLHQRDGKPAYLAHLPRVWAYLQHDLQHPSLKPLRIWFETHIHQQ